MNLVPAESNAGPAGDAAVVATPKRPPVRIDERGGIPEPAGKLCNVA